MRVPAEFFVRLLIRKCEAAGGMALIAARGDATAGAIYIKVRDRLGASRVYGPAPASLDAPIGDAAGERRFALHIARDVEREEELDDYLAQQRRFDPDLWVVEIDDSLGRHFLEDGWVSP